jgi:hypothetical protein
MKEETKLKWYSGFGICVKFIIPGLLVGILILGFSLWIVMISLVLIPIVLWRIRTKIEIILFSGFRNKLLFKIRTSNWTEKLPSIIEIESWFSSFNRDLRGIYFASFIWKRIDSGSMFERWQEVLKTTYVPCLGIEKGISIYDIYYCRSVDPSEAEYDENVRTEQTDKTRALLELLPIEDLMEHLNDPIHLNIESLHNLMIRQKVVEPFHVFCSESITRSKEIIAPMEVIEVLIKEGTFEVPVVFPQRFLAYLVKMDVENTFNSKPNPEKRRKVFDWYMEQQEKNLDFFRFWPKLLEQELQSVFKNFDKQERDEIFIAQHLWGFASTERLKIEYKPFVNNWRTPAPDGLVESLLKRAN